jgi:O-antigen ligase
VSKDNSGRGAIFLVPLIAFILLLLTVGGIVISAFLGIINIERPGFINVASVVGFIVLCILGISSYRFYFLLLPFILLAYPAATNDFFPSVYLGKPYELGASLFPFITHIDIYLLVGVIKKYLDQGGKLQIQASPLVIVVLVFFLLSTLSNIVFVDNSHLFALLICGLFPVRYMVLLIMLISNHEIEKFERPIITGLIFSIFFLLLESSINTYIHHEEMLNSGTLAANTFANITAAVMIFVIYLRRQGYRINFLLYGSLLFTGGLIILLTETRMAILAGIASFFLIQMLLFRWYKTFFIGLTLGILVIIVYNSIDVPDRYSVSFMLSKISFNGFSTNIFKMISIERSWETSSIYSRLMLYQTAIDMLRENPVWGIGYGTFNYLKTDFGFDIYVLIDAHNGYLNTLAQMGLTSVFFLYFIYASAFFNFKKIHTPGYLKYLFVLNFTLAIADFSNAGIYKPSVFALLAFSSLVVMRLVQRQKEAP